MHCMMYQVLLLLMLSLSLPLLPSLIVIVGAVVADPVDFVAVALAS